MALAAWPYSQSSLRDSQFSGAMVQFTVASLAGNMHVKKTARLIVIKMQDVSAQHADLKLSRRSMKKSAPLAKIAAKIGTAKSAHP